MTQFDVRESRRAPRNANTLQPRNNAPPEDQPSTKAPSFLAQAKADLTDLLDAYAEHAEYRISTENVPDFVALLWPLIAKKLAASYWNGVRDGASGKVKPKAKARRDAA
jgi:hypothetical protein